MKMWLVLVVALVMPLSLICWFATVLYSWFFTESQMIPPTRWMAAILAPIAVAYWGLQRGSLDKTGAFAGLLVGFILTISNLCFFTTLLTFFLVGSKATKFRAKMKKKFEDDFKEGGQRNWIQVLCNGGIAAQFAIIYMMANGCKETLIDFAHNYSASWYSLAVMGALACSCGDTLASELGTVFAWNTHPRSIVTWNKVPVGTNGGVSLVGTLCSILGGLLIGLAFYLTQVFLISDFESEHTSPPQWPIILVGMIAGILGSTIDSLLGGTFQYSGFHRKKQCIVDHPGTDVDHISGVECFDNHSVNLLSSLFTGLLIPRIAFYLWRNFSQTSVI